MLSNRKTKALPFALLSMVFATNCSKFNSDNSLSNIDAFSNRTTGSAKMGMYIIRLKTAPLFATSRLKDGIPLINKVQTQTILTEQANMEKRLLAISGNIKVYFKYRFIFNGLAVLIPTENVAEVSKIPGLDSLSVPSGFEKPAPLNAMSSFINNVTNLNLESSTRFMGAQILHDLGITGKGTKVGIIDTGIDYTHAMFAGAGTVDAYKNNDPTVIEANTFPTNKVIGGFDFIGSTAGEFPVPDADPLDENAHGTHVAGTVAGVGDGINTYDGVAPDAKLYALKVFPKEGSTRDYLVMAALEFAADPNQDLNPADKLDAVNLSLGSSFGSIFSNYNEALDNLSKGGIVGVISAGNSGHESYLVGNPGASSEKVISVAASIDNQPQNWKYRNSRFTAASGEIMEQQAFNSDFSKPIEECDDVSGELYYVGTAAAELSDEQKLALQGKVALIDRGEVSFAEKAKKVFAAGAIGMVVANNKDETPITMSGSEVKYDMPAIMIPRDLGKKIKEILIAEKVSINFKSPLFSEFPEKIDTITSFSSRGPRSFDGIIKPEISSPGSLIISAMVGSGNKGVAYDGTSMAAPHVAGAVALLKQKFATASPEEIRARIMNTAKILTKADKTSEDIALQGAGRIQIDKAANAELLTFPQTLSLGVKGKSQSGIIRTAIELVNTSKTSKSIKVSGSFKEGLVLIDTKSVHLFPNQKVTIPLSFRITAAIDTEVGAELDGFVSFTEANTNAATSVPVLVLAKSQSDITIKSSSINGKNLHIIGNSNKAEAGDAHVFHLLGEAHVRNTNPLVNHRNPCDLNTAGYRLITADSVDNEGKPIKKPILQIAASLRNPITSWIHCEISAQFDANNDKVTDQEVIGAGAGARFYLGKAANTPPLTILFDAQKMRDLATSYASSTDPEVDETYAEAIAGVELITNYNLSTLQIINIDPAALATDENGNVKIKLASQPFTAEFASDSFIGKNGGGDWLTLNINGLQLDDLPASSKLEAGKSMRISSTSANPLVVYLPNNKLSTGNNIGQSVILK